MKQVKVMMGLGLLVLLLTAAACSSDDMGETDDSPVKDQKLGKKNTPSKGEGDSVYPFTGIKTDDPVNKRALGVMINNHSKARPQSGLSQADMVFEILAEGKITRFLALFQSQRPDVAGPVRSAREYYFELANDYNALYVYHGAAGFVDDMIANRDIDHLNGANYDNDKQLFKREPSRKAPHNSYLLMNGVQELAKSKGYENTYDYEPLPFLRGDDIQAIEGKKADHVQIVYSKDLGNIVEFDYQEDSGTYTRSSDQEQTVDLNNETPLEVSNIMIIEADHKVIDDAGRRAINLEAGGDAYLMQHGKVRDVKWENRSGRLIPMKDGDVAGFVPGQTWINVVPKNPGMDQSVQFTQSQ